jgi:hypothetical protein
MVMPMRRGVAGFRAAALTRRVVRVTHDAWRATFVLVDVNRDDTFANRVARRANDPRDRARACDHSRSSSSFGTKVPFERSFTTPGKRSRRLCIAT